MRRGKKFVVPWRIFQIILIGGLLSTCFLQKIYAQESGFSDQEQFSLESGTQQASGQKLCRVYGVHRNGNDSQLFTVDLRSREVRDLGLPQKGMRITALAINPDSQILYAAAGHGRHAESLYRVDMDTGVMELVGTTGPGHIDGLAFRPSDGILWASTQKGLVTIDEETGTSTFMSHFSEHSGNLAWNLEGTMLYVKGGKQHLWVYEPLNGPTTPREIRIPSLAEGLEIRSDGTLLAVDKIRTQNGHQQPENQGGFDDPSLVFFVFDPQDSSKVTEFIIPGQRNRVEDIAWPGICGIASPGGSAEIIRDIELDKAEACAGEIITVTVDAVHPEGESKPVNITVNGKIGSPQYLQFNGVPGTRLVHVLATTQEQYIDSQSVTLEIVTCEDQEPTPIILAKPNLYRNMTIDLQLSNAEDMGSDVMEYVWDFGDGQTEITDTPYTSHFYGDALIPDEQYNTFDVELAVHLSTGNDRKGFKTVTIWNSYAFQKKRGVIQPPVEMDQNLESDNNNLVTTLTIRNKEQDPIALNDHWMEYQYCDPDHDPEIHFIETVDISIEGNADYIAEVIIPSQVIDDQVCGVAVHYSGIGPGNKEVIVSGYLEIQDNPVMSAEIETTQILDILNYITDEGLVANPDRVTDKELRALAQSGKIDFPFSGLSSSYRNVETNNSPLETNGKFLTSGINYNSTASNAVAELIGQECENGDPSPRVGITCQATDAWRRAPAHIANAKKGDVVLSTGCGLVGEMMLRVTPPQKYSHTGIMTKNFFKIRHSTSEEERYNNNIHVGLYTSIDGSVLKFGWPGVITQTIDAAYNGQRMNDPEFGGDSYVIHGFHFESRFCAGDTDIVSPVVVKPKPVPGPQQDVRLKLHAIADQSLNINGHYRFYTYSDATIQMNDDFRAQAWDSWWASETWPTACSGFVWLSAKKAGITLEGALDITQEYDRLDILNGAELDDQTEDGLYLYREDERRAAAHFLYGRVYNSAYVEAGWLGNLLTDAADNMANQVTNCFINDRCGYGAANSEAWKNTGKGRTVSPDDILNYWDPPPTGVYGYFEPLIYREGRSMRIYRWAASAGTGTITGEVRDANGNLASNVNVSLNIPDFDYITDTDGKFTFVAVPSGQYEVKAQKIINELLYEASGNIIVQSGQSTNINLQLSPPPRNFRRVRISGTMYMVDHETWPFSNETRKVYIERIAYVNNIYDDQRIARPPMIRECCGEEVRVDIYPTVEVFDTLSVKVHLRSDFFEGTSCGTDDLEQRLYNDIYVPEDSVRNIAIFLRDGDNKADIYLNISNERQP